VLRRILIVAIAIGLGACALFGPKPSPQRERALVVAPQPAEGLWAILDPGCAKPLAANFRAWPSCASPFWINGGKAVVLTAAAQPHGRRPHSVPYAADYSLTPGEPLIAQVGTERDGYLYLALTDLAEDGQGRLVGAVGAAVACPRPTGPNLAIKPSLNGCDLQSLATVRKAATATLRDPSILSQVAWIAPASPMSAP
jgi:hypothetical protein